MRHEEYSAMTISRISLWIENTCRTQSIWRQCSWVSQYQRFMLHCTWSQQPSSRTVTDQLQPCDPGCAVVQLAFTISVDNRGPHEAEPTHFRHLSIKSLHFVETPTGYFPATRPSWRQLTLTKKQCRKNPAVVFSFSGMVSVPHAKPTASIYCRCFLWIDSAKCTRIS